MIAGEITVNEIFLDRMTAYEMPADKMNVDKL